jgi:hypothetical protein
VTQTWLNTNVSCTSSIPIVSLASGVAYCLGRRGATFTIEALDWATGRTLWTAPLGAGLQYNSLYAATELAPGGAVLMGTMAGILHVTPL